MFRTPLDVSINRSKITYEHRLLSIGSCFSDRMGLKLQESKFQILRNPFGTLFHPMAIARLISRSLDNQLPPNDSYIKSDGVCKNFEVHSSFVALSKEELSLKIAGAIKSTHKWLYSTDWLVITFGSAFSYVLKSNDLLVANCHKIPQKQFKKQLASADEIVDTYRQLFNSLLSLRPNLNIVLTVSPVRHLRDSLEKNNLSKSILRVACNTLEENFECVSYFPSYEIMMDDLRDYRFYSSDMLHPSEVADSYIWHQFSKVYFDTQTVKILDKWQKIQKSLNHRPMVQHADSLQKHYEQIGKELEEISRYIDVTSELHTVRTRVDQHNRSL